jgi:hypothetical protein
MLFPLRMLSKVKVRDRERVEPPHVTILHKTAGFPR